VSNNNVAVISDIHLEYRTEDNVNEVLEYLRSLSGKAIFVAGDVCPVTAPWYKDFFLSLSNFNQVFYVPGNHEYYGTTLSEGNKVISSVFKELGSKYVRVESTRQYLLTVDRAEYHPLLPEQYLVLGDTLWYGGTDNRFSPKEDGSYTLYNPDCYLLQDNLNDFRHIKDCTVNDFLNLGTQQINNILSLRDNTQDVILFTHHIPFSFAVSDKYKGERLNCYFVNHISNNFYPKVVIHGHTHEKRCHEYLSNGSLLMCNPQPYKDVCVEWFNL
jgi:predicted phosphodiesterase